jgi:hypothetical protein
MQEKHIRDSGGRELVFRDKLPGKLSIAAPGEGGFVFVGDFQRVSEITTYLTNWMIEHSREYLTPPHGSGVGEESAIIEAIPSGEPFEIPEGNEFPIDEIQPFRSEVPELGRQDVVFDRASHHRGDGDRGRVDED